MSQRFSVIAVREGSTKMEEKIRKFSTKLICGVIPSRRLRKKYRLWRGRGSVIGFLELIGVVLGFRKDNKSKYFKNKLSIVAIAKNEGAYFKEWIEYHRLVGVDKFYIYDNESSDNTVDVLKEYIDEGLVDYTFFPGESRQIPAYVDCIKNHKHDTEWLAIIDLDEFIVPVNDNTIIEYIEKLTDNISQILIGWFIYGSSGNINKPDGLVTENYLFRGEKRWLHKSIINPRLSLSVDAHESMMFRGGTKNDDQCIRINHYHCKSWEEYKYKKNRGDAYYGKDAGLDKYTKETFTLHDLNDVYDPIMNKYIGKIRDRY